MDTGKTSGGGGGSGGGSGDESGMHGIDARRGGAARFCPAKQPAGTCRGGGLSPVKAGCGSGARRGEGMPHAGARAGCALAGPGALPAWN